MDGWRVKWTEVLARSRALPAALLFLLTFAVGAGSLLRNTQLGYLRGLSDRWLALGLNLSSHGVLGEGEVASVFKPPGYPALVSATLLAFAGTPIEADRVPSFTDRLDLIGLRLPYDKRYLKQAVAVVYWSNAVLLAASASLMFLWLASFLPRGVAFTASLLYGVNPYSVALIGLLHYSVTHLFLVVLGCLVLQRSMNSERHPSWAMLGTGALWGVVTLFRPPTLILPPFVLLALLLRSGFAWRRSLLRAGVFTLGFALSLAPYTARNYALTGRVIPVSLQAWMGLWGSTSQLVPMQPNHYRWKELRPRLMRLLATVPQSPLRTDPNSTVDNLRLDDHCREVALNKLRRQPEVYIENVLRSFVSFNVDINPVFVKLYQYHQQEGAKSEDWYWPGSAQDFHPALASDGFAVLAYGLTILSAAGLIAAIVRRDASLLPGFCVYLSLAVGHTVIWMDLMYYYVKLPFLFVFAFYFVSVSTRWSRALPGGRGSISAAWLMSALIGVYTLALTVYVVWGSG